MFLDRLQAASASRRAALWGAVLCLLNITGVFAQSAPVPAPSASAAASELSPAERARRDADKVFRLIMIHSDKPRSRPVAAKEETASVATKPRPGPRAPTKDDDAMPKAATAPDDAAVPVVAAAAVAPPPPMVEAAVPAVPSGATTVVATTVVAAAPAPIAVPPPEPAIETLTPLVRAEPQFPPNLMRSLRKGQVQVQFTVLPDGRVDAPTVLTSSSPRLNASALAAVTQWRFVPLRQAQSAIVELGFDVD